MSQQILVDQTPGSGFNRVTVTIWLAATVLGGRRVRADAPVHELVSYIN